MNKNFRNYMMVGLTVGTLTLGGGLSAYAASVDANTNATTKSTRATTDTTQPANAMKGNRGGDMGGKGGNMGGNMDYSALVSAGTIDQATADKMTAFMATKNTDRQAEMEKVKAMTEAERTAYLEANKDTKRGDMTSEMVTSGIITQAQADAMEAARPERADGDMGGKGGNMDLTSLVTAGTIDQATADKMTAFMATKDTERQAEMEKVKAMTETERTAYFEANKDTKRGDFTSEMVTSGIITQAQADAIIAARPERTDGDMGGKGGNMDLTSLVTAGTIDQATADKMTAYMTTQNTERQAEMEKVKAMTETERTAYFAANKDTMKGDRYSSMVTDGIITQAQADAINAAKPARPDKN